MTTSVEALEAKLGYRFSNPSLLLRALTHRSRSSELPPSEDAGDNEQLEFLGDSILGFVASEALVARNPLAQEGDLSQLKAQLVSSTHLYQCALKLDLGQFLRLGKGEERNGGRERKTLLADAVEAIIAAIHLDSGIDAVRLFIQEHVLSVLSDADCMEAMRSLDHKSALQETVQAMGLPTPRYTTIGASGPEHAKVFLVEASVGNEYVSRASGSSKKAASQHAAQLMIEHLRDGAAK